MDESQHLVLAKSIAKESGNIMKKYFLSELASEWKEDETPVTIADKEVNSFVIKRLKENFSDHAVLGEEESTELNSEYVWVCDPIDGTIPFSHGVPNSAFTLALTLNGESILGVSYDPYNDRLVYAEKGKGAFLNGKKISVSKNSNFNRTFIDVESWSSAPYVLEKLAATLGKLGSTYITTLGSTVYPGMLVAIGFYDAIIFCGKTPWDIAATKIIVEEAGGKVTDQFGNEQKYTRDIKGAVVSNGLLHDEIIKAVAASRT